MANELNVIAFDCGNSSTRTILCHFDGRKIESELILQEENNILEKDGYFFWEMDAVFDRMKRGLAEAARKTKIDSVGICTWGIDFWLTDDNGEFLGQSLCYRNDIGSEQETKQSAEEQKEMFYRTGILCDKINTIYMLRGMHEHFPDVIDAGKKILLVPDILVYMLTGKMVNEPSELSTSGMADVRSMNIDARQCEYAGVSPDIFCEKAEHGKAIGNIRREILDELGIEYDIPVVCVPSHDTACAVMAIPSRENKYLFVSSGTWSLIGALCEKPIINEEVRLSSLTNEQGGFGWTTLLRNSGGMFIVQRLKKEYEAETGRKISWAEFTAIADEWRDEVVTFDVNEHRFFNPKVMVDEITQAIHPGEKNHNWAEILASTYISLGDSFAQVLANVQKCTGDEYNNVYIVGGGCKNIMICQRCADKIGMPVVTCDMECSSVGNAVAQLPYFYPEFTYEKLREIIADSLDVKIYYPEKEEK